MNLFLKKRKSILRKFLIGAGLFSLGTLVFFVLSFVSANFFPFPWSSSPFFLILLITLTCLAAYRVVDHGVTHLFRHFFFQKKSYAHMALMHLAEELLTVQDLKEVTNQIVNSFGEILHLKTVALLVYRRSRQDFAVASSFGWTLADAKQVRFTAHSPLLHLMARRGAHVLIRDQTIRMHAWQDANRLAHDLDRLHANWVIPLWVSEELVGCIAFSSHRPGNLFDESDFQFFREFAKVIAVVVHNAVVHQELEEAYTHLQGVQSTALQETKRAALEQLATGLAHEIHNPLTIISGKAQVLLLQKERYGLDERCEEALKTIVKQTKRAADITRKLLMFSQSSGSVREPLSLNQVLEDTLALVSYRTSLEGIEITRDVSKNLPPFVGNVHELREVFLNVILNAVESLEAGGRVHIQLGYRSQDQIFELLISDTGRGIPAEHLDKVFNPFFTTRQGAVGLGLFVTQQIVRRYGGSIRLDSRPGEGSLLAIRFPYAGSAGTQAAENVLSAKPSEETASPAAEGRGIGYEKARGRG